MVSQDSFITDTVLAAHKKPITDEVAVVEHREINMELPILAKEVFCH
ncbi:predicted protein [Sclerotinia sclerotiorum 1980 UF-70]|uniref:Uncharacterized protein n=1 Tax=Sclerotinia sclerotiorum (strain ATCC 18683 / 1980 / Ss-1) TaxID=665079 RepID=A7EEN3_SCLS1|nr:predicted protein [Sclerotinia sclerotiorum 1980 UF-70]EDO01299.1 predicted protein [Sclerotinia sclerotiorum 1980 UF-70]